MLSLKYIKKMNPKKSIKAPPSPSKEISNFRRSLPQIIAVFVKNSILFVYGTSVGMPTILIPSLSGNNPNESIVLNQEEISWIASLQHLCVPVGCILSGIISQPMGRKRAIQFCSLPFLVAFSLYYFSTEPWHVFLGLCLTGMSGGLIEAPACSYTSETTEPNLRGALTTTSTFFITLGIVFSFLMGSFFPWRIVALINSSIPLVGFLLLMLIPETPYWLISHNRVEEAQESLAWLRGWTTVGKVEKEFLEIQENIKKHATEESKETVKLYTKSSFIKPFLLILLTFALGHFGVSPINIYSVEIYLLLKVPISSYYAAVINGCVNLTGTTLSVCILRYSGKRVLVFISLTGVCVCFAIAASYTYVEGIINFEETNTDLLATSNSWIPMAALVSMGFFSYLLIYSLPWILMGEIYYNEIRDVASGLSAATGYLVGFVANKTFLNLVTVITLPGVFWFYSSVAFLGIILMFFVLPETEGKTLFEISEHYAGGNKLNNNVLRNSSPKV